jgi:hypothetical protein
VDLHLMIQVQGPNIHLNLPHLPKIRDISLETVDTTLSSIKKKLLTHQSWERKKEKLFSQNQLTLVLIGVILCHQMLALLFLNK